MPTVDSLETMFKKELPKEVIYTKVPRGLVISMDETLFFDDCDDKIKTSSLYILDKIALVLKKLPNYCVIEDHVQKDLCGIEDWELSMMRSANLAEYLVRYKNIPSDKIFDIGFGETMPFKDNVSPYVNGFDNRVDFVIIDYEAKR